MRHLGFTLAGIVAVIGCIACVSAAVADWIGWGSARWFGPWANLGAGIGLFVVASCLFAVAERAPEKS